VFIRYPTFNSYAPYCHLWTAQLYDIVPHFLINSTSLGGEIMDRKYVFWFSVQLLSETFLNIGRLDQDIIKNVYLSSCTIPVFLSKFNETWIFSTDLKKKCSNFHETPSCGNQAVPRRQAGMTNLTVAFHNFVNMPKNKQNKKLQTKLCKSGAFFLNLQNG